MRLRMLLRVTAPEEPRASADAASRFHADFQKNQGRGSAVGNSRDIGGGNPEVTALQMMTTENSDLYEATCLDCNTTKSYFTAQGVGYFKLNHEGHNVKVREPAAAAERQPVQAAPEQARAEEPPLEAEVPMEPLPQEPAPEEMEPRLDEPEPVLAPPAEPLEVLPAEPVQQVMADERVRLGNLVVDVVDEEKGRVVKVYGIAGGMERFSKGFDPFRLEELNGFLESGAYYDDAGHRTYTWSPDKIDLSTDVVRMLDEPQPAQTEVESVAPAEEASPALETAEIQEPREVELVPEPREAASPDMTSSSESDEVLLGKLSYVQPGEQYRQESVRISNALRRFRWNIEPPYVIGAMFDNLLSVQGQTGIIKSSVIDAVTDLGYAFVAIEAPAGVVTAWFRKNGSAKADEDDTGFAPTPIA